MKHSRNEHGVVLTWLLQIVLVIAVVGTVLFDAGSIAWNYFAVDTRADDMALELSGRVEDLSPAQLEVAARRLARDAGGKYVKGSLELTEDRLRVGFRRDAQTLVVGRIGAISDWAEATATGSAPTS